MRFLVVHSADGAFDTSKTFGRYRFVTLFLGCALSVAFAYIGPLRTSSQLPASVILGIAACVGVIWFRFSGIITLLPLLFSLKSWESEEFGKRMDGFPYGSPLMLVCAAASFLATWVFRAQFAPS